MSIDDRVKQLQETEKLRLYRLKKQRNRRVFKVIGVLMLSIIITIITIIAIKIVRINQAKTIQTIDTTFINGLDNPYLGSETPKLTIVEFGDFACPHCHNSFAAAQKVLAEHPSEIKIIWRDSLRSDGAGNYYGVANESVNMALAARCANEQGKFAEIQKIFLTTPSAFTQAQILEAAAQIGLAEDIFRTCMENQKYGGLIAKDAADAATLGVTGTPTWYFNGQKLAGEITIIDMQKIVNSLLQ